MCNGNCYFAAMLEILTFTGVNVLCQKIKIKMCELIHFYLYCMSKMYFSFNLNFITHQHKYDFFFNSYNAFFSVIKFQFLCPIAHVNFDVVCGYYTSNRKKCWINACIFERLKKYVFLFICGTLSVLCLYFPANYKDIHTNKLYPAVSLLVKPLTLLLSVLFQCISFKLARGAKEEQMNSLGNWDV